ncbi:MAG: AAA-like domain-containing protein [Fimbriimonadaceae bacterium]|nr:AAA-like domain-containing protein [Fimbriimonadaceae bacterium]
MGGSAKTSGQMGHWGTGKWHIRLLGRFDVRSASTEAVRFPSRSAAALLALLALEKGKEFAGEELRELFWPESDGDRQAQNLRRAVSDIRRVLEEGLPLGSVIGTPRGRVVLNTEQVSTDVERFNALVSSIDDVGAMQEAVSLYSGPLFASSSVSWLIGRRMDLEERFSQTVERLTEMLIQRGDTKEAIRIGRSAVVAAQGREDVHISLIRAYRVAGMDVEALRQFEELERILDDTWGEKPSIRAFEALNNETDARADVTPGSWSEPDMEPSGGAVPLGSKFYVRRREDAEVTYCIDRHEGVLLLQGPRQVGKSSLLARSLEHARSTGSSVGLCDLQSLGEPQLAQADTFFRTLAFGLAKDLDLTLDFAEVWSEWLGPNVNLDNAAENILKRAPGQVCWALDEADLLFDRPYTNDFFGLLRSWHNRRALNPSGPWAKLTLIITYATEAHLFISDLNQSPFNVGIRVPLKDFTHEELVDLASRYSGLPPNAPELVGGLTNGHPYLSRRAFAYLSKEGSPTALESTASLQDGPFGDHLQRILISVAQDPENLAEVKRLLSGEGFLHPTTRYRLWSAGITSMTSEGSPQFRVPVYGPYLRSALA